MVHRVTIGLIVVALLVTPGHFTEATVSDAADYPNAGMLNSATDETDKGVKLLMVINIFIIFDNIHNKINYHILVILG